MDRQAILKMKNPLQATGRLQRAGTSQQYRCRQPLDLHPRPNRSPAKRGRFGSEEQRRERALAFEKSRSKRYKACSDVVPVTGLEPVRCRQRWILSPLRLPIPSHRQINGVIIAQDSRKFKSKFCFHRRNACEKIHRKDTQTRGDVLSCTSKSAP